jgi:hypothetical protein
MVAIIFLWRIQIIKLIIDMWKYTSATFIFVFAEK